MPKLEEYSDPILERNTLAALLQSQDIFTFLDKIQPNFFTDETLRNIFILIKDTADQTGSIPSADTMQLSLTIQYPNNPELSSALLRTFKQLERTRVNSPLAFLYHNLVNFARARDMLTNIERSLNQLSDGDLENALSSYQDSALSLQSTDPTVKVIRGEFLADLQQRKAVIEDKKLHPEKYKGIYTGIDELDAATGGLWKGELGFAFGRTGVGKSFFLLEVALTAYKDLHKVLVLTIEMPKEQWQRRLDSRTSHVAYKQFKEGTLSHEEEIQWDRMMGKLSSYAEKGARLWTNHIPLGCTLGGIRAELEYYKHIGEPVDLLVVDYGDLIQPPGQLWSEQAALTAIFRELKGFASIYDIPVWTASQAKQGTYRNSKMQVEDVFGAAGKAQISDLVLGISCTDEDKLQGRMFLHVTKGRDLEDIKPIMVRPRFDIAMIDARGL